MAATSMNRPVRNTEIWSDMTSLRHSNGLPIGNVRYRYDIPSIETRVIADD
jgi:hypothetical protein